MIPIHIDSRAQIIITPPTYWPRRRPPRTPRTRSAPTLTRRPRDSRRSLCRSPPGHRNREPEYIKGIQASPRTVTPVTLTFRLPVSWSKKGSPYTESPGYSDIPGIGILLLQTYSIHTVSDPIIRHISSNVLGIF